jgi:hypothetical protein
VTDPSGVLAHAADQLRRIGPDGREDVSLAVAFELGRMLVAAQPGVISALLAWRQGGYGRSRIAALLARGGTPLHALLASVLAQDHTLFSPGVTASVLSTLGAGNAAALGPPRSPGAPPAVVPAGQSLDQVVSQGFGLDAAATAALLGSAGTPAAGGLPATATTPTAPQQLADLTEASFVATRTKLLNLAGGILRQTGATPPVIAPPVLNQPAGFSGARPVDTGLLLGTREFLPVAVRPLADATSAPQTEGKSEPEPRGTAGAENPAENSEGEP